MKHLFLPILLLTGVLQLSAQVRGTLVVFSEDGDRFFLVVNGLQYNQTAQTNVKAENITQEWVKAKILFEDQTKGSFDANIGVKYDMENTYMIKLNKKGEYKLAWRGEAPLPYQAPVAQTPPPPAPAPAMTPAPAAVQTTTVVTQQTTTRTEGVSVGMSVPDGEGGSVSVGISMNVPGMTMGGSTTTTVTQQQTTTTQMGTPPPPPAPVQAQGRCAYPMDQRSYSQAISQLSEQGFDETRLTIAKQIAKSNCLTSVQVRDMMRTFGFDETRLDFAKFAYPYCYDPNNYFMVNSAFEFESSSEELARFTRP